MGASAFKSDHVPEEADPPSEIAQDSVIHTLVDPTIHRYSFLSDRENT